MGVAVRHGQIGEPGLAAPEPQLVGRPQVCRYEGVSPPAERCVGAAPWHIADPIPTTAAWRHRLVAPDGDGLRVLDLPVWDPDACELDVEYALLAGRTIDAPAVRTGDL